MTPTLLTDLDGVVRTWDASGARTIEERHGLRPGAIAAAAFGSESRLLDAVTGRISDEVWRSDIAARLRPSCGPTADEVVAEWSEPPGAVDGEVMTVLADARARGWRIALLTNATTRLERDLARLGIAGEFDAVFNSSELGAAKPDVAVFDLACRRLDVVPGECVYVDDAEVNVRAASRHGLQAHVYVDPPHLADLLASPQATRAPW